MLRELHHIPLHQLKVSKLNVRRQGAKEIDSLAASISVLGIIQPLLVRSEGDGYEIVAGRRRYLAAKKLDADGRPDAGTVPCVLLEADDDATALEASLAENVERLPMDELEQYEGFAALRRKGLGEGDIAAHFAISEQVVKRRLAIANLHPDIRRLYRAGDIDSQTLQLLTLATKERQKAWLAINNDPEQEPPPAWQLKAWLLGGAEISTKAALFDETVYQGGIAADLFGEPLRVTLHVLVAQHILGCELVQPGCTSGGNDLFLPLGIENVLHAVRDVASFHEVGIISDSYHAGGNDYGSAFGR